MNGKLVAHTPAAGHGQWHMLADHLWSVAELTRGFSGPLGLEWAGFIVGALHDLGKAAPEFQDYLQAAHSMHARPSRRVDHKLLGALAVLQACKSLFALALPILGHHSGLPSLAEAKQALQHSSEHAVEAQRFAEELSVFPDETQVIRATAELARAKAPLDAEFMIRLLYSCLVDADALDTEAHFEPRRSQSRGFAPPVSDLVEPFAAAQERLIACAPDTAVNRLRRRVYEDCIHAASADPGVFSLTVPTGGGKTRSSLAFALQHASRHGLERVIYAMPYTTIIEQTCDVFRQVLPGKHSVLEHHSFSPERALDSENDQWALLSSENWDAPVIVTTTVQFFESLFGNRPGRCRKVHRVARSVIVLDEAQTLPERYLEPIVDGLRTLVDHYGSTVVLCTATQPALTEAKHLLSGFKRVREIASTPTADFKELSRVQYVIDLEPVDWRALANQVHSEKQVLVVVNTIRDAQALMRELDDPEALHLSTRLCPAHRRVALQQIRTRLREEQPCRVISTQVIEAGVDLDFPTLYRAIGPLDRIVQAAGRCNREGRLSKGIVKVFNAAEGSEPGGAYKTATDHARIWLERADLDLNDPSTFPAYFRSVYADVDTDARHIQQTRKLLDFPEVSSRFSLIDDDTAPVLVPFKQQDVDAICSETEQAGHLNRYLWRRVQQHSVSVRWPDLQRALAEGLAFEIVPALGVYRWAGQYDPVLGLVQAGPDPADLIV